MRYFLTICLALLIMMHSGCVSAPSYDFSKKRYVIYRSPSTMAPATVVRTRPDGSLLNAAATSHGIPRPSVMPGLPQADSHRTQQQTQEVSQAVDEVIAAERARAVEDDEALGINAIEEYEYANGMVYPVVTSPGYVTTVELQANETVLNVAGGDTANWLIDTIDGGAAGERSTPALRTYVLIKPRRPFLQTNLIITTNLRAYHLELSSLDASIYHTSVKWAYTQSNNLVIRRTSREEVADVVGRDQMSGSGQQVNYGYNVLVEDGKLPPVWAPLRVYDDGRQVFVEFTDRSMHFPRPVIFGVREDGEEYLVNYRVEGNRIAVHSLLAGAALKLGTHTVKIERTPFDYFASPPR